MGLLCSLLVGLLGGMSAVVQWRVDAIQRQLSDRMAQFQYAIQGVEKRLDKLEAGK